MKTSLGSASWDWSSGESPLHYAALSGRADLLRRMVEAGADIDAAAKG